MQQLYRLSIYNEDGSDIHTFCQSCTKEQIYWVIETYRSLYTQFEKIADDLNLEYGILELTDDKTHLYWDNGHIVAENLDTGEFFSYISAQGGYGLEPFKEIV
tara:strand:- start:498 stop:806 length:309 start_codon:yes stop_codon:yes gene_type:complete